jgi:hypothetical protein
VACGIVVVLHRQRQPGEQATLPVLELALFGIERHARSVARRATPG